MTSERLMVNRKPPGAADHPYHDADANLSLYPWPEDLPQVARQTPEGRKLYICALECGDEDQDLFDYTPYYFGAESLFWNYGKGSGFRCSDCLPEDTPPTPEESLATWQKRIRLVI